MYRWFPKENISSNCSNGDLFVKFINDEKTFLDPERGEKYVDFTMMFCFLDSECIDLQRCFFLWFSGNNLSSSRNVPIFTYYTSKDTYLIGLNRYSGWSFFFSIFDYFLGYDSKTKKSTLSKMLRMTLNFRASLKKSYTHFFLKFQSILSNF